MQQSASIADPAVWAVQREALLDAGGLDETLWSIGVVDDLAARLHASIAPDRRGSSVPAIAVSDVSYPYASPFATFLTWRNRLRLAFAHAPAEDLGAQISVHARRAARRRPGRATGLDAAHVSFGGDWGRASLATRLRTRFGGPPPDALWPRDEIGTAVRLAALHAFALELPDLLRLRDARGLARERRTQRNRRRRVAGVDSGLADAHGRASR